MRPMYILYKYRTLEWTLSCRLKIVNPAYTKSVLLFDYNTNVYKYNYYFTGFIMIYVLYVWHLFDII